MQASGDRAQVVDVVQERIGPALDGRVAARERRDDVGPPVADVRHEFLEHRERHRLARAGVLDPAREPRHVAKGGAGREEARDLEIRVEAGLGPAQRLQHEIAHHTEVLLCSPVRRRPASASGSGANAQPGWAGRRSGRGARRPSGRRRWRRARAGRTAARDGHRPPPPRRRGPAWLRRGLGRHGHRDVVRVTVHRDEQEHERPVGIEDGPVEHVHRRDAAGLGREPALADQEAREIGAAGAREQRDERGGVRAERPRCHRRAGRAGAAAGGTSSSRRAPG